MHWAVKETEKAIAFTSSWNYFNSVIIIAKAIHPLFQDSPDTYNSNEVISLPVYYSQERDHIVARIDVPCGGNQSQWLQCGAALFLKTP